MSTKIYHAFRTTPQYFAKSFLPTYREHCFKTVAARCRQLMDTVTDVVLRQAYAEKGWGTRFTFEKFEQERGPVVRLKTVFQTAAIASAQAKRDLQFDIDCSLNIWLQTRKVYIICYGEPWVYSKYVPVEHVQEYGYWNSADCPDDISHQQWQKRGEIWDAICDDWNGTRLVHTIVQADQRMGIYDVAKLILPPEQAQAEAYFIK